MNESSAAYVVTGGYCLLKKYIFVMKAKLLLCIKQLQRK